jgi:hypothetical protein
LRSNPRCARLGVCRRARLRSGLGLGEAAGEWRGPTSRACLTGCTPEGASVTWRRGLTLVRASSGATTGGAARMERYSTEVQQLTRTRADSRGRGRTVTCRDGRGWTCCRQMACKRSAVRARLAPLVSGEIRTNRTAGTAAKYSNGGRVGRRTCVRIGYFPGWGLLARRWLPGAGQPVTWANTRLIGSVTLVTWPPPGSPGGPFPPVTAAAFASSPVELAVLAVRSTPGSCARGPWPRGR